MTTPRLIYGQYGANNAVTVNPARLDTSTMSLQMIDYPHHENHAGSAYFNEEFIQVPANDVLDIRWQVSNTTRWSHWLMHIITEGEFHITFYEDVAALTTAGTALTAKNRNRNSANASNWQAFDYIINVDLSAANADTNLSGATTLGTAASGSGRNKAGEGGHDEEIICKQDSIYCMRFENQSGATKYVDYVMDWYEHTDKA